MFGLEEAIGEGPSKGLQNGRELKISVQPWLSPQQHHQNFCPLSYSSPNTSVNEQSSIHLSVDFSRLCAWPTNVFSTQLSHTPLGFFIWSTSFLCFWEQYPSSLPPRASVSKASWLHSLHNRAMHPRDEVLKHGKQLYSESNWPRGWQTSTSK